MLKTTFFTRDIPEDYGGPIPNGNYEPYDLFCLSTRLYPLVHKVLGADVKISYDTVTSDEVPEVATSDVRHYLYIKLSDGGKPLETLREKDISLLEAAIVRITSEADRRCLVFSVDSLVFDKHGRRISNTWIKSMIQYVAVPFQYDPILTNEGMTVTLPVADIKFGQFHILYSKLSKNIISVLVSMYHDGYISVQDPTLIKNWDLSLVPDTDDLYHPSWTNTFGDLQVFLRRAFAGYFQISVGDNKVVRHAISEQLDSVRFLGCNLIVKVSKLSEVRNAVVVVRRAINLATGRVLLLTYKRLVWEDIFREAAQRLFPESPVTVYKEDDIYVFSCLRPVTEPSIDEQLALRETVNTIFAEKSVSYNGQYDALENNPKLK